MKYIVTMIDYFSKWPEAAALADKSAKAVAMFIYQSICRFDDKMARIATNTVHCYIHAVNVISSHFQTGMGVHQ